MPIRSEFRKFYNCPEWREARKRILKRARNRCEQCGKPNHRKVWVYRGVAGQYWTLVKGSLTQKWRYCGLGGVEGNFKLFGSQWAKARRIRVLLNVAHLNHKLGDDRDENLKALCQWCHLNYDKIEHAETRKRRKDAARPLLT